MMARNRASAKKAGTQMEFVVPGPPISQGSKNAYQRGGRVILVESRHDELQGYRARVALAAARFQRPMLDEPVHMDVTFVLPRPKRPKFDQPAVPPDVDKYQRAIFDALTEAGVWKDDSRVVSVTAVKRYAEPGERPQTRLVITRHDMVETA